MYVDDPLCCIRVNVKARARSAGIILIVWLFLGFPIAYVQDVNGAVVMLIGCM